MASKFIFTCAILLVVLCLFSMKESSDYIAENRCTRANAAAELRKNIQNRKLLAALKGDLNVSSGGSSRKHDEKLVSSELRVVPSGPDPLHHNGCCPKNPTTTP